MIAFSQLHAQNHKITELSNVFIYLVQNREMCDTDTACDVFFEYATKVKEHIELVDRELCGRLMSHPDQTVKNTADRFLSGSVEIKRIFNQYLRSWCSESKRNLKIKDHDEFVTETEQMFALVLDRIQRETEHLYPLIRRLDEKTPKAA
jgi:uncharacterized protein YecA (UPF0149 family)